MAGLAEVRGPAHDTFWTWREVMYRFLARLTPDDVEAIAAQLYVEMLEAGFTAVGEFHYLHHDVDGRPYAEPAEMAERIAAAAAEAGIGLTLLPCSTPRAASAARRPTAGQRRFVTDPDSFARLLEGCRRAVAAVEDAALGIAPHSLARGHARRSPARGGRWRPTARSTSTPPSRCGRWRTASPGPAGARSSGCSARCRSTSAGA